jgi:hypothetical protein
MAAEKIGKTSMFSVADFVGGHFQNGGHWSVIFIMTNQFLTSK